MRETCLTSASPQEDLRFLSASTTASEQSDAEADVCVVRFVRPGLVSPGIAAVLARSRRADLAAEKAYHDARLEWSHGRYSVAGKDSQQQSLWKPGTQAHLDPQNAARQLWQGTMPHQALTMPNQALLQALRTVAADRYQHERAMRDSVSRSHFQAVPTLVAAAVPDAVPLFPHIPQAAVDDEVPEPEGLDPVIGNAAVPTVGSVDHDRGGCIPCAFVHKGDGCSNGEHCNFCHLCEPSARKLRHKDRKLFQALGTRFQ